MLEATTILTQGVSDNARGKLPPTDIKKPCDVNRKVFKLLEPRTSNLEPRTSNLEPRTSNLEPRTSNLEPRTFKGYLKKSSSFFAIIASMSSIMS